MWEPYAWGMCRPLTRRELMRYGALVAATFPAARLLDDAFMLAERAYAQAPAFPMNLELVTVSDTVAVMTWFTGDPGDPDEFGRPRPAAAPGRVLLGSDPDPTTWEVYGEHGPTAYHYVEIHGLDPGTTYYWRAESAGVPATPTASVQLPAGELPAPVAFTTLVPPPGRELGTVVWMNDLHFGEMTSGLAIGNSSLPGGGFPPGFAVDPDNPYWRFMAAAGVAESRGRGARVLFANGDVTGSPEPESIVAAKSVLGTFGQLGSTVGDAPHYFVTRGNHDRGHSGAAYEGCSAVPGRPDLRDCFSDAFAASFEPGTQHFSVTVGDDKARFRFVGLDSSDIETGTGVVPDDEIDYLQAQLGRDDATFVLCHHMVSDIATTLAVPPVSFGVEQVSAAKMRAVLGAHDNVAAVYNGHTHRNHRTIATDTASLPYFEGGATKEYPGGYTTVRLFEGGYMVNFWKAHTGDALAWSERSRGEYLGLYPYYTLGGLTHRNWVREIDSRRVSTPRPPGGAGGPGGNRPGGLPATGQGALMNAAAAALTGAALTARSALR